MQRLRDLINKAIALLQAVWRGIKTLKPVLKALGSVMRQRRFWISQSWQLVFVAIIVGFWTSQGWGVLNDAPPPIMWITSALMAIVFFGSLTAEAFMAAETLAERYNQGMLLLQTIVIVVGNLAVIGLELVVAPRFTIVDWVILGTDAVGLSFMRYRISRGLDWKSPWARFGFATSLKATPQFVTAVGVAFGLAKQGPWAIFFLLSQCAGRLLPALKARLAERKRGTKSDKVAAQVATTGVDQVSAVVLAASWTPL